MMTALLLPGAGLSARPTYWISLPENLIGVASARVPVYLQGKKFCRGSCFWVSCF